MEMGKAWLLPMEKTLELVIDAEGIEAFESAHNEGKGVILLAPHLGNWEFYGFHLCEAIASTWLYQPPKYAALDTLITQTRSRAGVKMAQTNQRGVAEVFKALKNGEAVGVLPDQVPPLEGGTYAPFFDVPALTMTLVSKLVQKTEARVFCGFAKRLPASEGFKVIIEEAENEIYSSDLTESVAALNRSVEKNVLKAVEQYQWEYKRFRKQADGTKFY